MTEILAQHGTPSGNAESRDTASPERQRVWSFWPLPRQSSSGRAVLFAVPLLLNRLLGIPPGMAPRCRK